MSGNFSDSLIQLGFPAAIQVVALLVPVLYFVAREQRNMLEQPRNFYLLYAFIVVCEVLYVTSVTLLVLQDPLSIGGMWVDMTHGNWSVTTELLVLLALTVLGCVPIIVLVDWSIERRKIRLDVASRLDKKLHECKTGRVLDQLDDYQPNLQRSLVRIIRNFRIDYAGDDALMRKFDEYCSDHQLLLTILGLETLSDLYVESKATHTTTPLDYLYELIGDQGYKTLTAIRRDWRLITTGKRDSAYRAIAAVAIGSALDELKPTVKPQ